MVRDVSGSSDRRGSRMENSCCAPAESSDRMTRFPCSRAYLLTLRERSTFGQGSLILGAKVKIGEIKTNYYAFFLSALFIYNN